MAILFRGQSLNTKWNGSNVLKREQNNLSNMDLPAILIGDFNIIPTENDVYKPEKWKDDALYQPEVRKAYSQLLKNGWTDSLNTLFPDEPIYTFWDYLVVP